MAFAKILLFSTLLCVVCSTNPDKGYVLLNGSIPTRGCYDLPRGNTQCPSNVINHKVFGLGYAGNVTLNRLKSVDLTIASLKFYKEVTQDCKDAVREYECSNTFPSCVKDESQPLGLVITFNVTRTTQACAKVKKYCPLAVQIATTNNCSIIIKNFTDILYCVNIPNILGDVCPKSRYKYPKAMVDFYPILMNRLKTDWAKLLFASSPQCKRKILDVGCELVRGTICSDDMMVRMYTTSQQQCQKTMTNCLPSSLSNVQPFFLEICKLFPDGTTAKMAPLPNVDMGNNS